MSRPQEQTAALVLEIDKDGLNDFVIGGRGLPPALSWFRWSAEGWTCYLIEAEELPIETRGAIADIDRDGDLDLVLGGDYTSNVVWWRANSCPNYTPDVPWLCYLRAAISRGRQTNRVIAVVGFQLGREMKLLSLPRRAVVVALRKRPHCNQIAVAVDVFIVIDVTSSAAL